MVVVRFSIGGILRKGRRVYHEWILEEEHGKQVQREEMPYRLYLMLTDLRRINSEGSISMCFVGMAEMQTTKDDQFQVE